jgi:hypothetical protein
MQPQENERPPFLGSWSRLYSVVIVYLVLVILALGWFANAFKL